MRRPDESAPQLFQLLPDSSHVPPEYTLAGVQSEHGRSEEYSLPYAPEPSHSVTALYTPDGTCKYQQRVLTCRLSHLDDDHEFADDIAGYHEATVADKFNESAHEDYTDWVESSVTEKTINGFDCTVRTVRKPILSSHNYPQQLPSRPVLVTALVVQTTPWGVIETGTYQWPDPDPGDARETVTTLAATLTHRADRLSRPTPDDQWPLFYGHDMSQAELVTAMQTTIAELTDEQSDLKDEDGAVLATLLDRFQADYDVAQREALKILDILDQRGDINDSGAGVITLT